MTDGFAVMEDDTVLCADCVHELCDDREPPTAATFVHAWLADPAGQACRCCGADGRDDHVEGGS
jgi:hypothetical protein